ncbi:hypothetical protein ACFX12_015268 [Malus domestica]
MGFPIRLNRILLGALIAFPLLLTVLFAKVLFNPSEITQSSGRIVVYTRSLRADVNSLLHLFAQPLPQLPWQIMAPSVELQVLVPLEAIATDLAHEMVRSKQGRR